MTPLERTIWERIERRAVELEPEVVQAIVRLFRELRARLTEQQIARLLRAGALDELVNEVADDARVKAAATELRTKIRSGIEKAAMAEARFIPQKYQRQPRVGFAFDTLNQRVVDALRSMEVDALERLSTEVREGVRERIRLGIEAGKNPVDIARSIRDSIGLTARQEQIVANVRAAALKQPGSRNYFDYILRDRRFDALVRKGNLTPDQLEALVQRYRERLIQHNAEAHARTIAIDASRLGQRLSWEDAIDRGVLQRNELWKRRRSVGDKRVREEHREIDKEEQPFDQPYSNGEMYCGEKSWNCRCIDHYYVIALPKRRTAA